MPFPRAHSIDEKLSLVAFHPDTGPHIAVDHDRCGHCLIDRACVDICPAQNYRWDDTARRMSVSTESCFECGSCRIVCTENAITWNWPQGGFGVMYTQG